MTISKALVGFFFTTAVVTTTVVVTKKVVNKKYVEVNPGQTEETESKVTDIYNKIKTFVKKKVDQILGFCAEHQEQIAVIGTAVSLVAGALELVYGIKRLRDQDKLLKTVEDLYNNGDAWEQGWSQAHNDISDGLYRCSKDGTSFKILNRMTAEWMDFSIKEVTA